MPTPTIPPRRRAAGAATPLAVLVAFGAIAAGCHAGLPVRDRAHVETASAERATLGTFRPTPTSRPPRPALAALRSTALAGTVPGAAADDEGLGARYAVRPLRLPATAPGATATFDYEGGKRGWVTALPRQEVLTTPAYGHGRVFVGGGFASRRFFAFDAFDGELDWSLSAPDGGPSAAIVEDRWVVFNTESCTLFVADAETGELRWKRWLGDPLMSQPVVAEGLVMSAYPGSGGHRFGAFRLSDGEPVWDVPIPGDVIQAPQVAGDAVYFATMDGSVHRVRVRDGEVGFRRAVGASSAVWVAEDRVLVTRRVDRGGQPHEQPIVLDAGTGRIVHRADEHVPAPYLAGATRDRRLAANQAGAWGAVPHGEHLGLRNVAAGWAFQGATPAVADGRAYVAIGGEIRARDVATGETVWRRRYREAGDAQALTPPAVVGSVLVFGTVDGQLFAADVDTGMVLFAYDVGEPIVFQPVVAQGWVYAATGKGRLVALEVGDPAVLDGWHMWGGNPQHGGLVDGVGRLSPALLASLARPGQGILEVAGFEEAAETSRAGGAGPPGAQVATARREHDEPVDDDDRPPPLPLLRTEVDVAISGPVARVQVTQVFDNPHDRPIEARYLFPLPERAAVDAMEMRFDGRVVRGRIRRRQAARETYERARADGRRAALLEQQRPNLFAQRVANVPPGGRIEVALTYVQLVPRQDGAYALRYPMLAAPRFDPRDPGAVLGPRDAVRAPDEVSVQVSLDAGLPLGDVSSPSHPITVTRGTRAGRATVELDPRDGVADRDFVLRYELAGDTPRATVLTDAAATGRDAGHPGGHLTLLVEPPTLPDDALAAVAPPRDVVFLVDASSSMGGRPMDHARAIVDATVDGLRPGDRVGVVAFSDGVRQLPGGLRRVDAATRAELRGFLGATAATGSTVMAPALDAALGMLAEDAPRGRLPMLVLLSDGFVGNEAEVLGGLVAGLGDARVFTVGLGPAPNGFLLRRAASIGRGRSLMPAMSDLPAATARRFVALIDRPVLTDVEVDWGGLAVEDVYPRRLPDLFAGAPLIVHARYQDGGTARVAVRGTWAGRRHERVIEVTLPAAAGAPDGGGAVRQGFPPEHAALWARAAVADRVDRSFLQPDPVLTEEIAALGLAYGLVTSETSFVAVEEEAGAEPSTGSESDAPVEAATRTTVTPARALPGDPEIRIPAPVDARAVTVILPFGETLSAAWEPDLGVWTARFLIPDDAREGSHSIDVLVTHRDGRLERLRTGYTVDASAPRMDLEVLAPAVPGGGCRIRATQRLSEADLRQAGYSPGAALTPARAALLEDVRRVEARLAGGAVVPMAVTGPRTWEAVLPIPPDARGVLTVEVFVADLAANVRRQTLDVPLVAAAAEAAMPVGSEAVR